MTVVLPTEQGTAAKRLVDADVDVVQTRLHRLRATANPLDQFRFLAAMTREVAALRRLIRERNADVVQIGGSSTHTAR